MIVDAHVHLGDIAGFYAPDTGARAMLALMDALGIDRAISMHGAGLMECFEEAYTASQDAYAESGGCLPYALTFHPLYPESLDWIRRALGQPGFVGIKIHPGQHQVYPEDARYDAVWRFAAEHSLPVVTHSWALSDHNPTQRYATPEHFESRAAQNPQVSLVLGHAGGRYEGHLAAVRLAQRYPNIHLDLSGDVYALGLVEWLVGQVGAGRILFGSDMAWIDPRTQLGPILDAAISLEDKRLILGENARRLFKIEC